MVIIDGKKIAEEIKISLKDEIIKSGRKLKLAIVQVGENEISKKFIGRKIKFAKDIGVETEVYNFPAEISDSELGKKLTEICDDQKNNGVILQLPLPSHIDTQCALDIIPIEKDVDVLSSRAFGGKILTPVVGAIKEILVRCQKSEVKGLNASVIGNGLLVGKPSALWLMGQGATVSVINEHTPNPSAYTLMADIIISGAGKPGLIKSEMVKEGVMIIDAAGDVEPAVAEKASLFTPILGGVGPITVAMVFKNLLELNRKN